MKPASAVVSTLSDGFYFFKDPSYPELVGIIQRLRGRTWRIGEYDPMPDCKWDDGVKFYPAIPPSIDQSDVKLEVNKPSAQDYLEEHFVASISSNKIAKPHQGD